MGVCGEREVEHGVEGDGPRQEQLQDRGEIPRRTTHSGWCEERFVWMEYYDQLYNPLCAGQTKAFYSYIAGGY